MGHEWLYALLYIVGIVVLVIAILLALRSWWMRSREKFLREFRQGRNSKS